MRPRFFGISDTRLLRDRHILIKNILITIEAQPTLQAGTAEEVCVMPYKLAES